MNYFAGTIFLYYFAGTIFLYYFAGLFSGTISWHHSAEGFKGVFGPGLLGNFFRSSLEALTRVMFDNTESNPPLARMPPSIPPRLNLIDTRATMRARKDRTRRYMAKTQEAAHKAIYKAAMTNSPVIKSTLWRIVVHGRRQLQLFRQQAEGDQSTP